MRQRQTRNPLLEIFYWKDHQKKEVDSVVKEGQKLKTLIQACVDVDNFKTKEREVSFLLKAANELHCKNLEIVTLDYEQEEKIGNKNIHYLPLWKWLLRAIKFLGMN